MDELALLHRDIGTEERLRVVEEYEVARIICAPGHRSLRAPMAVKAIADRIAGGELGDLLAEPILLGIFTEERDGEVVLRSIDCLDGNHRLLGGLLSGRWLRIGDIPLHGIGARVNGWPDHGSAAEPRWIPLEVAKESSLPWSEVPPEWGAKGPTAQIPGWVSGLDPSIPEHHRGIPLGELLEQWHAWYDAQR